MAEEVNDKATIYVKANTETTYTIEVPLTTTVLQMKEEVEKLSGIPAGSQRLIYSGQVLKDEKTLESYGG